jgi:peroxiredoxin
MFRQLIPVAVAFASVLWANAGVAGQASQDTTPAYELRTLRTVLAASTTALAASTTVKAASTTARPSHKLTSLADQANGGHLLVVVYPEAGCTDCRQQLARLAKYDKQLRQLNTRVIAVAAKTSPAMRAAVAMADTPFALVSDPSKRLIQQIALRDTRSSALRQSLVLFDRCGKERARLMGNIPGLSVELAMLKLIEHIEKQHAAKPQGSRCGATPVKTSKRSGSTRI